MRKAITGLLVLWGSVMSVCTIVLMHDVRSLRDVAQAEANLIDARDDLYKTILLREAQAIDLLNAEVDTQEKIIEKMQEVQDLQNQPKSKAKGTSL